jgi:hypothetical protein
MAIAPISRLGRAWAFAVGIGVVTLLAAPLVFHAFYTTFQEYDDEGYLLISLRDYARGGVLTTRCTPSMGRRTSSSSRRCFA